MSSRRIIWHVWDAAAHWAVQRLLDEDALPALGSIVSRGLLAAARPPWPNTQTPPALATLFTGVDPATHGITGFNVPDPQRGITAFRSGFSAKALRVPPIWSRVPEWCDTTLVHVPWAFPDSPEPFRGDQRFVIEGYSQRERRGGVVALDGAPVEPCSLPAGSYAVSRPAEDFVSIQALDGQEILLRVDAPGWRIWQHGSIPATLVRAIRRPCDRVPLLLHLGAWRVRSGPDSQASSIACEAGPFVGEGLGRCYRRGDFGPALISGGDGWAERVLLDTIRQAARYFERASVLALDALGPVSLTVAYQPCIDDISHELIGLCDPSSPVFDAKLATRAWLAVRAVYQWADSHLAALLSHADADTLVVVSSDHGMAGISHRFYANGVLERAGLLAFDEDGSIDQRRTDVALSPAGDGSVWINELARPGGTVPPWRTDEMLDRAQAALEEVREPVSGRRVVVKLLRAGDGLPATLGDAYLLLAPGFHLDVERPPESQLVTPFTKTGGHLTNTGASSLSGILAAAGPELPASWTAGSIRNSDVATQLLSMLESTTMPQTQAAQEAGTFS